MKMEAERQSAFICTHVATDGAPILSLWHSEPVEPGDSGWAFHCGKDEHNDDEILVVALETAFRFDPDLRGLLTLPRGSCAFRLTPAEEWEIGQE
jgi:hypothetical protein